MSSFNISVFNAIYNFGHRSVWLAGPAIFFAQYLPYFLVLGFLVLVFFQKGLRGKIYLFCEGTLAIILARGIIANIIYFFYQHPRPFDVLGFAPLISESGSSFPSGHMVWFFALAMVVWYANRKWGIWYFILALAMGVARIYVGVHWPFDILGGAIIGILSAMVIHWLLRESRKEIVRHPELRVGSLVE
jgi:undecaprenyl-diphosphatase